MHMYLCNIVCVERGRAGSDGFGDLRAGKWGVGKREGGEKRGGWCKRMRSGQGRDGGIGGKVWRDGAGGWWLMGEEEERARGRWGGLRASEKHKD